MTMLEHFTSSRKPKCSACFEKWGEPDVCTCPAGSDLPLSTITPAEVGGLVERLRKRAITMNGAAVGASDGATYALGYYDQFAAADDREAATALAAERAAHAETRRERDEAIKAAGDQATLRGEAEGKLAASEMAGIVDGWKRRAEAYRTQRDEALKALEQRDTDIAEFMGRLGSRWFLEQGWFPKSVGAREDDARRVREGGNVDG